VLSEESAEIPFSQRSQWPRYWLVDPLDGTKEFVSRNGEFTVNIALTGHRPEMGVVHIPVTDTTYGGIPGIGAWRDTGGRGRMAIAVRRVANLPCAWLAAARMAVQRWARPWMRWGHMK
jgi:3'(2'), 5'-bisphosphate nucleotidase